MGKKYLNYYELLGIENNATNEEILKAYKEKAKEYHPDKNEGHHTATKLFQYINDAKETLLNDEKRQQYDEIFSLKPRREKQHKVNIENEFNLNEKLAAGAIGILAGLFIGRMFK